MPSSYCNLLYHIVFSTKERYPWLNSEVAAEMHAYLGGAVRNLDGIALGVGGQPDHVHILAKLRQDVPLSKVIGELKANASRWMHKSFPEAAKFAWQTGYGAFSVSESQVSRVKQYIAGQEEHHRTMTFQEEFLAFLKKNRIEYDERYIWE